MTPAGERLRPIFKDMYSWGISYAQEHGEVTKEEASLKEELYKKIGVL